MAVEVDVRIQDVIKAVKGTEDVEHMEADDDVVWKAVRKRTGEADIASHMELIANAPYPNA